MKYLLTLGLMVLVGAASIQAKDPVATAKDDASQPAYSGDWVDAGGGTGFGSWKFQSYIGPTQSYAGHFLAVASSNPEIASIATGGKAFGLYANGPVYEIAIATRGLSAPLQPGDSFSFQMKNLLIEQKGGSDDPNPGAVGLNLRTGNASGSVDDYNKGLRFGIGNYKGEVNYQVYDGEPSHDTGVVYSEQGIAVTVTLTGADTYDLEITNLGSKQTKKLPGRKLAGTGKIESFCIFDRNGEKADGFFNSFQVLSKGK